MSDGYRGGSASEDVSIRRHSIVDGSDASAFVVMKMRPPLVPAHTTLRSDGAGAFMDTWPPERSSPHGNGPVHATVQALPGMPAGGQSACGPKVRRPGCSGLPIAFQSSQTSIAGSRVPFPFKSRLPVQWLHRSFTVAYGKLGFTPPFCDRNTCSLEVNISLLTVGWNTVGAMNATSSRL